VNQLGAIDLAILLVYLVGSVALGVWLGRGQKTASDYMLGGRNLSWWVVLITIVATETSTVTYLSTPSKS
jgi:Na+/proline symporter